MKVQIKKWGNSLAVRIRKVFAEESNIKQASVVNVSVVDGKLVIEPVTRSAYTLEQMLAGINCKNIHEEIDFGRPVGKEVW
jgi:antitoxin MazE